MPRRAEASDADFRKRSRTFLPPGVRHRTAAAGDVSSLQSRPAQSCSSRHMYKCPGWRCVEGTECARPKFEEAPRGNLNEAHYFVELEQAILCLQERFVVCVPEELVRVRAAIALNVRSSDRHRESSPQQPDRPFLE